MADEAYCTSQELLELLKKEEPVALLDVREKGEFFENHILRASNAPLSILELIAPKLVPSPKVKIVVYGLDEKDIRPVRASKVLKQLGYSSVDILSGGIHAWQADGLVTVAGTSCMAKGYAELLEEDSGTPRLSAEAIVNMIKNGKKVLLADIRDSEEFERMSIPGGVHTPGCELAYRIKDLAPDPETLVVTNCGARTRGILCAQLLRDMGIPNPVAYMAGGTLGWKMAGNDLESGRKETSAPPSYKALQFAKAKSEQMAKDFHINFVDGYTLSKWKKEDVPLYIFDVRQLDEYLAGHIPGSYSAPGCQLAQLSDDLAAVRNARYVLVDDTEARAIFTAYWLKQLAIPNVFVLEGGLSAPGLEMGKLVRGNEPESSESCSKKQPISIGSLAQSLSSEKNEILILNVGNSEKHRDGHIPGAVWVSRGRLNLAAEQYPEYKKIIIVSDSLNHAILAAEDAGEWWPDADLRYLEGNATDWIRYGHKLESGIHESVGPIEDHCYLLYKDPDADKEALMEFLDWDNNLGADVKKDGTFAFVFPNSREAKNNA